MDKGTKSPNVDFLAINLAVDDLRADPVVGASTRLSIRLLLRQEYGESEICDLNVTIAAAEDVIRLDISVEDVLLVQRLQSFSR